jgi:phospholipid/cholesterol/gamma-HCH transport system substrate-binding protein
MIFGKTKMELKVGIFVFAGLILLGIFVLSIGGFKTWTSGYKVKFSFNFVNGVKLGAPVRFAGVDVGQVKKLRLVFDPVEKRTKIEVLCWIRKDAQVPHDSTVWVNTLGLLGEKYIEIMPGRQYEKCITQGEIIVGQDPMPMHEVTELAKKIGENLSNIVEQIKTGEGTIGKLIYDDTLYKNFEGLSDDLRRHPWKLIWKTKENK